MENLAFQHLYSKAVVMKRTISFTALFILFAIGAIATEWCHVSSSYYNLVWNAQAQKAELTPQYYTKSGPESLCEVLQSEANTEAIEAIGRTGLLGRMNIRIKYKPGDFNDIVAIDVTGFQPIEGCSLDDNDARDFAIKCVKKTVEEMELHQVMRIEIHKDDKYGIVPIRLSNSL